MLDIGSKIMQLRKEKNMSQTDFAKAIGASRTMVGNYERNVNAPSIDMVAKIAGVLDVSVDYLIGQGKFARFKKETLHRIEEIEQLDEATQKTLFELIDTVVRDFKTRKAHAK